MAWQLIGNISGKNGKDIDIYDVRALVVASVGEAVKSLPLPRDGRDGKDGLGVKSAVIDRSGKLVLTLSDGSTKDVGHVVGKDGSDGHPGKNVDPDDVKRHVAEVVATFPIPKDGKDGMDGLGFDDLDLVLDDARGFLLRFTRGELVKEFEIPVPHHEGIWEFGRTYPKGAMVTANGGSFVALTKTSARPDESSVASRDWKLAAKRGRDGKPGRDGRDKE